MRRLRRVPLLVFRASGISVIWLANPYQLFVDVAGPGRIQSVSPRSWWSRA